MEKETAKIPGSLLARRWRHSDRSNQLAGTVKTTT
jgi:hypothetical protein